MSLVAGIDRHGHGAHRTTVWAGLLVCLMLAGVSATAALPNDADALVGGVVSNAAWAAVLETIATKAVENAGAARTDAETAYLAALRSNDRKTIEAAEDELRDRRRDMARALGMFEEAIEASVAVQCAAKTARASVAESTAGGADDDRRARGAAKRLRASADVSAEALARMNDILAKMKQRWLVPALGGAGDGGAGDGGNGDEAGR